VKELPGPYFFVADGVLPYLREDEVTALPLANPVLGGNGTISLFQAAPQ
jgi:hypothetical protein